jgi:putative ABC transport system permease protein
MSLTSAIRVALAALLVNKGRSILTSLGIVIGIMAVIAMVAAGSGARETLDDRLESVGKNLILIRPYGKPTSTGMISQYVPLTPRDVRALREDPELKQLLVGVAESQHLNTIASTPTANHHTTITGGRPAIFTIRNWKLAAGRFYTEADVNKAAPVCVLGESARQKLFPHRPNPIGERVRVLHLTLEVVGLLEPKGRAPTGADQDDQVFVPITTLQQKLAHGQQINLIVTAAKHQDEVAAAEARIRTVLREKHRLREGQDDDFQVSSVQEMAQLAVFLTRTLNILIVVIASISLVVGGIGIMNIMLVSVTERTREIGIRMAVGATTRDIRNQFLIEAVVLSLVGGIIGVTLGMLAAAALAFFLNWPVHISPFYVGLAFGVAAAVGVFFGYYPAAKAARLDPIEALRYE